MLLTFEFLSFVIGTGLGVLGLLFAYIQWKETQSVERLRREQLLAQINRAKYLIIPNEVIEKILIDDTEGRETLRQWLWSLHKGASDNYVNAVYYYLSFEKKFTYEDLDYAIRSGVITSNWEEHVWRSLIALRDENRKCKTVPPEFKLDRDKWTVRLRKEDKEASIK